MRGHILLGVFLALAFAGCRPAPIEGKVVSVVDGDTIGVIVNGQEQRIRLYGIDAPEKKQPYGSQAKAELSSLVFGQMVQVASVGKDRYGRTIAKISTSDVQINVELVRRGSAWWYRAFAPNDSVLEQAELEARKAGRGLWASPSPTPPWDWRKSH